MKKHEMQTNVFSSIKKHLLMTTVIVITVGTGVAIMRFDAFDIVFHTTAGGTLIASS